MTLTGSLSAIGGGGGLDNLGDGGGGGGGGVVTIIANEFTGSVAGIDVRGGYGVGSNADGDGARGIIYISSVPEPDGLVLIGSGILALLGIIARRRRAAA